MTALRLAVWNDTIHSVSTDIQIIPTIRAHIEELRDCLRAKDRAELEAYGFTSNKGLWRSYKSGLGNRTAIIDGHVAACWGCGGSYLGTMGVPWLLTSEHVHRISPLKFARLYQKEVYEMLEHFDILTNYVHAEYDEAVRLLSIVGFTIGDLEPLANGVFRRFTMRKAD